MSLCTYLYLYIYIYVYIYIEREREIYDDLSLYIYIYEFYMIYMNKSNHQQIHGNFMKSTMYRHDLTLGSFSGSQ